MQISRLICCLALLPAPALAQSVPFDAAALDSATFDGGDLPDGQSALTVKVQTLLDRAGTSPGVIDGWKGGMSTTALKSFERRHDLTVDGVLDQEAWQEMGGPDAAPIVQSYTITEEDASGLVDSIPDDYSEQAKMDRLAYLRVTEKLAERFHMAEEFLIALNGGGSFDPGRTITVVDPGEDVQAKVARVEVDKPNQRVSGLDEEGNIVVDYPVTVGSGQLPSPSGIHEVEAIAIEPTYTYRPDENFQQGDNDERLILPPGPNNPVGRVWIDLSKDTYGLHGWPHPAELFTAASHGCVRMTNWDATELAHLVSQGVTVEFLE
ncbi:L,D-transpeptidase [Palleronia sp.]|uniref:L,D-transpeptidase family protein n=1 Tax=Palleronia sp. TaxID=1940284 RepID=UPI0035C86379